MNKTIFFKEISTYDSYLLIGGANQNALAGDTLKRINNLSFNEYSIKLFISNMLDVTNKNIRLFVGNVPSKNTTTIHKGTINTGNGKIYIGNIKKTKYLVVDIGSRNTIDIEISVDTKNKISLVYVFLKTGKLTITKESEDTHTANEQTEQAVSEIGKNSGCHICGKTDGKHLAVLLPPPQLDTNSEHNWFPVCPKHYDLTVEEVYRLSEELL